MQAAMKELDVDGRGRISRREWEEGLKRLGYTSPKDVQEVFTVLDKRCHHSLTLSDLMERRGISIQEGQPEPGLEGLAAEFLSDIVAEASSAVLKEVLQELLQAELLEPRPTAPDPNLDAWMEKAKQTLAAKSAETLKPGTKGKPSSGATARSTSGGAAAEASGAGAAGVVGAARAASAFKRGKGRGRKAGAEKPEKAELLQAVRRGLRRLKVL
eukprot:CAMPEP_0170636132 /NCGR_PEP_ID=MMETSP0224-20130122/37617_1 /TAXON_ID=285029 /ORGANISM="Togula jolla, Strain CCCM 725" /LENGTH=213 /DNA_ID=CAMNT_0010965729 /DNA_START=28 /DNA_END=666 /DNA_ORIENTATION=-